MERLYCGIDIGGTKLSIGLMDRGGVLRCRRETDAHTCLDENCLLDLVADEVRLACDEAGIGTGDLDGAGVGMAGHIRHRDGVMLTTSNLQGFKNYPVAAELARRLGVRVLLENDANCQALAEHRYGAGRGFDDMVFVTVSTGIGAGLILNGRLYRGLTGTAGEIGHCIIEPGSDSDCTCGNRGCFMAHACTLNLESLVRRRGAAHPSSPLVARAGAGGEETRASGRRRGALAVDGRMVDECARRGDKLALEIIDEYTDYLGIMLYNLFQVLNPAAIVMGGGLMNWGEEFFTGIKVRFFRLVGDMLYDPIAIVPATIKKDSGLIGAAALAVDV